MKPIPKSFCVFVIITFSILLSMSLFNILFDKKVSDEIKCKSSFTINSKSKGFTFEAVVIFVLIDDSSGILEMDGSFINHEINKRVSRIIRFNYHKHNNELIVIKNFKTSKYMGDNMDDTIFNKEIFDTNVDVKHFISISKLHNALLISNSHSPIFICEK